MVHEHYTGMVGKVMGISENWDLAGGKYVAVAMDSAHVQGNLVTAPAWPAHPAWLAKFVEKLGAKITL